MTKKYQFEEIDKINASMSTAELNKFVRNILPFGMFFALEKVFLRARENPNFDADNKESEQDNQQSY